MSETADQPAGTGTGAGISRRGFLATTSAGLAAASSGGLALGATPGNSASRPGGPAVATPLGPYDSCRDFVAAMDARGRVLHIDRVDQDAFEATALMYRLVERHGLEGAPVVMFDEVRINGEWIRGPVIGNYLGHWDAEALVFGLEPEQDGPTTFRKARDHLSRLAAGNGGRYPQLPPLEVPAAKAACKEVILRGREIDLSRFPFMKVNPGDGGRFINTASVFTSDPKMGVNLGTYRCQLKGPRKVAVSPGEGQTGWRMLMAAKNRGDKTARVALVLGQDPVVYVVSGSRVANRERNTPLDELAVAGGLRGKPLEVVRSESGGFLVPAHAEMVIEGEIPLAAMEPEGPYGEGLGYQGKGETAFWMNVTTVTHRRNPWFHNSFTGVDRGPITAPGVASSMLLVKKIVPEVVDFHYRSEAKNIFFVSIDKTTAGQGLEVGEKLGKYNPVAKVVVVLDSDVDLMNMTSVIAALSSRWQPHPAARLYEDLPGLPLDPSQPSRQRTSKIVIDATRQLPGEGGPKSYPPTNRSLLLAAMPDIFARVDAKWGDLINR